MNLSELQPRQGKVDVEVTISALQPPRTYNKMGSAGKVCNATITDGTASMTLTLWNEDCDKYQVGDKVKITNGYVSEWQGEMQLGTGKYGKVEKL